MIFTRNQSRFEQSGTALGSEFPAPPAHAEQRRGPTERPSSERDSNVSASQRRVAVIGAGVSGLTAAYVLHRGADVTLFEAEDRLGGHAHTHDVAAGERTFAVDSGFIVHNERTYPYLLRLFRELGVATQPTEMSMSVSCRGCGLEYAGSRGFAGLFARGANAANPRYLNLLRQVPAFYRRAHALIDAPG